MPDIDVGTEVATLKQNILALKQDMLRSLATKAANAERYRATYFIITSRIETFRDAHVGMENPNRFATVEEFIESLARETGFAPIRRTLAGADRVGKQVVSDKIGEQFDKLYRPLLDGVDASLAQHETTRCANAALLIRLRRQFQPKGSILEQAQLAGLHPKIADKSEHHYASGHYDDAILNAFKTVEIEVRDRIKAPLEFIGVNLISKAMSPNAPLIRFSKVEAEQRSAHNLFHGAIGWFKNPQSHRVVGIDDRASALEMLCFASHLMRMLDNAESLGAHTA